MHKRIAHQFSCARELPYSCGSLTRGMRTCTDAGGADAPVCSGSPDPLLATFDRGFSTVRPASTPSLLSGSQRPRKRKAAGIGISFLLLAAATLSAADQYGDITITPIRHATFTIQAGNRVIFVDPWSQAPGLESQPKADIILITDIHGDHMDPKAIAAVRKPGTQILAPAAVAKTVTEATVIDNGESKKLGDITVEAIPMYNEKRGPSEGKFFHDKGRGNGYVVTYNGKRIYIAGDTEGHAEMRALKNIDIAFVPMNLPYTMPPEEAAEAVKAFKPKVVYPYHYRNSDIKVFSKALEGSGIEVREGAWY